MKPVNTIDDVAVELRRALLILKCLPMEGPKKVKSLWPEYKTCSSKYDAINPFTRPMLDELRDMDLVLEVWLKCLDLEDRQLVFLRAAGVGWRRLQQKFPMARSSLYNRYLRCLKKILDYAVELQKLENNKDIA